MDVVCVLCLWWFFVRDVQLGASSAQNHPDIKLPSRSTGDDHKEVSLEAIAKYLEAIQQINVADRELEQMLESVKQTMQAPPRSLGDAQRTRHCRASRAGRSELSRAEHPQFGAVAHDRPNCPRPVANAPSVRCGRSRLGKRGSEAARLSFLATEAISAAWLLECAHQNSNASPVTQTTIVPSPTTFEG